MRGNTGLIIGGLGILAIVLLGSPGVASQSSGDQSKPASGAWMLPDTSAQQAVVRQYLDLLAAERYPDAWRLLTPSR